MSASTSGQRMKRFWDRRAREDAFYFVDNRLRYGDPDVQQFWDDADAALDTLLSMAGKQVRPDDSVVDIGCGVGRLSRPLAARASEVWAVDVSEEMLDLARRYNASLDNVHWLLSDGQSLAGIPDASVDGIVSLVVFQHIPDPNVVMSYVREMGRVLRPGGWTAFHVSNDPSVHRPRGRLERIMASLSRRRPSGMGEAEWLGSAVDLDELRDVAAGSGLSVDRIAGEGTQFCVVGARRLEG